MTSQEHANILLADHQAKRNRSASMSKMELSDWGVKVKPHLDFIGSGAAMAARHAKMLPCKPDFETLSENDLARARGVLELALQDIITAQQVYASKPVDA